MNYEHIKFKNDGTAEVTRRSLLTFVYHTKILVLTPEQYQKWQFDRVPIQDSMSNLTSDEREFVMTGITKEEWDKHFGG